MAHHGPGPFADQFLSPAQNDAQMADFRRARAEQVERMLGKLGATGEFPQGKLTDDDEGEIRLAIGQKDGKVVIDFGKPIAWIGFDAEQAESIADLLREHAQEIRLRR